MQDPRVTNVGADLQVHLGRPYRFVRLALEEACSADSGILVDDEQHRALIEKHPVHQQRAIEHDFVRWHGDTESARLAGQSLADVTASRNFDELGTGFWRKAGIASPLEDGSQALRRGVREVLMQTPQIGSGVVDYVTPFQVDVDVLGDKRGGDAPLVTLEPSFNIVHI